MVKFATRYMIAVLSSVGMGIIYGLKVNLHVAIVCMVNYTAIRPPNASAKISTSEDGPFNWSNQVQGFILSGYFWGYIVVQIPGGRIAEIISAKWVLFYAIAVNVFCTLLIPIMAELHYVALIVVRVGQGLGGGVTFPANHVMIANWAPPNERSVMSSVIYTGTALGTAVFTILAGVIGAGMGWRAIFYVLGGGSSLWLVLWAWFVADNPRKMKYISEEERNFITSALDHGEAHDKKKSTMPWKAALTSCPFITIAIAHVCSDWGWYMINIELPLYMKTILNFKIKENAVLSAIPYISLWLFSMILSHTLDTLRSKNILSTTAVRKIATSIACVIPMACFVPLCYITSDQRTLAVVLMTVAITGLAGKYSGFLANHIDIAPNFAGTLMAITNTIGCIPGIIVPIFVGMLTEADPSITSWRIIFWTTIAVDLTEMVVFLIFATGEVQPWNNLPENSGEAQ